MALKLNLAQINSAAKGNSDLRETLTGIYNEFQSVYSQVGRGPLTKVDSAASAASITSPPPPCTFLVSGANGSFSVAITLPQNASGATAPKNATNAPIYQQLASSAVANFSSGVTTYPVSTNTSLVFPNPGATLYWRLRSSYDQRNWNQWSVQLGAVDAGLQSSSATASNLSLNQSNYATVDSVANGAAATVRIYGPGGIGTSWTRIAGSASQVIPGGTILNLVYGSNAYVAYDGRQYQVKNSLTQTFPDNWIPVGRVSVIANGKGVVLPQIKAVVVSGAIVAFEIVSGGNDLTAPPTITITDTTGSGATTTAVLTNGSVTQVQVGSSGSGYSSSPTVTASGGISAGAPGGGGSTGSNGGRIYADV